MGLQLFYQTHGFAPTSTEAYHAITKGSGFTVQRDFPSHSGVLRCFSSFREAWTAAGVVVDRGWEPWSELEEWYLREATGLIPRTQIAIDLRRTDAAVKRRQYDLGIHARTHWGWSIHAAAEAVKMPGHRFSIHIERGDLPIFRGNKHIYIDPADLIGLSGIDWRRASKEIKQAAKKSLLDRLTKIIAGVDWRAGRIYQPHPIHHKRYKDRLIRANPKPNRIRQGDVVEVAKRHLHQRVPIGRSGIVKMVHFSTDKRVGMDGWRARVEFKKQKRHGRKEPRVIYSIPLIALRKIKRR